MERLDTLAQPVAFATASLGLAEPKGHSSQSSTESDDSDMPRSNRKSRKPARDDTFMTAHEGELGRSVKASVVDLKNEFDEIAEEGNYLALYHSPCALTVPIFTFHLHSLCRAVMLTQITTLPTRSASCLPNPSPHPAS